jgi:hypothetical protein
LGTNGGDIQNNHDTLPERDMRGLFGAPQHDCGQPIGRSSSSGSEQNVPEISGVAQPGLRGMEANTAESKGTPSVIPGISGPLINTPPAPAYRGTTIDECC